MAKEYGFDGVDLSWKFPEAPEKGDKPLWSKFLLVIRKFYYIKMERRVQYYLVDKYLYIYFSIGSIIYKVAASIGISNIDSKEAEHKEQFTALIREVKGVLNANNCPYLSVSILPHVNTSGTYNHIHRIQI